MALDISRFVVVTFSREGNPKRASGFHLSRDLVLTAGHIRHGNNFNVEYGREFDSVPAKLVWGAHDEYHGLDVGLLRAEELPDAPPVRLGLLERTDSAAKIEVWGWCYPKYQGVEVTSLDGVIKPASGYSPRANQRNGMISLNLSEPGPGLDAQSSLPGEAWSCASGGAVLVEVDGESICVGVVSQYRSSQSPQTLRVATFDPLRAVLKDGFHRDERQFWSKFWEIVEAEPLLMPRVSVRSGRAGLTRPDSDAFTISQPPKVPRGGVMFPPGPLLEMERNEAVLRVFDEKMSSEFIREFLGRGHQ